MNYRKILKLAKNHKTNSKKLRIVYSRGSCKGNYDRCRKISILLLKNPNTPIDILFDLIGFSPRLFLEHPIIKFNLFGNIHFLESLDNYAISSIIRDKKTPKYIIDYFWQNKSQDSYILRNLLRYQPRKNLDLKKHCFCEWQLECCKFRYADLEGADFRRGWLVDTDFTGANLTGADLRGADLTGTKLTKADVRRGCLVKADLTEADVTGADFTGADFMGADLTEVDLTGADFRGAHFSGANLTEANLTEADLTEADLTGANLKNTNLKNANLKNAILNKANLEGADLTGADLQGIKAEQTFFRLSNLTNANLKNAHCVNTDFSWSTTRNTNFDGANLNNVSFYKAELRNASFLKIYLENVDLSKSKSLPELKTLLQIKEQLRDSFLESNTIQDMYEKIRKIAERVGFNYYPEDSIFLSKYIKEIEPNIISKKELNQIYAIVKELETMIAKHLNTPIELLFKLAKENPNEFIGNPSVKLHLFVKPYSLFELNKKTLENIRKSPNCSKEISKFIQENIKK